MFDLIRIDDLTVECANGTALNKGSFFTAGLTWKIDLMKAARTIINKAKKQ